jgi:hypothetical protein
MFAKDKLSVNCIFVVRVYNICLASEHLYEKLDNEENMIPNNGYKSDQVFRKLPELGYSEKVAEEIWRWYHSPMLIKPVHSISVLKQNQKVERS